MKNIKKLVVAGLIGIFVLSSVGCDMIAKTPEAIKKAPVAKINGDVITKEQLDARMAPTVASFNQQYGTDWQNNSQYKQSFDEQKTQMVDNMVNEVIIIQQAKSQNGYPKDTDVNAEVKTQMDSALQQTGGDEKQFESTLKTYGFTKDSYTAYVKQQIIVSKCVDFLLKDVTVSDDKVKQEYDTNKDIKYTTQPSYMQLSHILVATEAEAKAVKARLDKGEDFAKVAKEVSTDTGTKDNGGDLGQYFYDESQNQQQLDPTFVKAAEALNQGQISDPVQTQYGWHIIKCVKKVIYPAKKFDDVKNDIKTTLLNDAKNTELTNRLTKWKSALGSKVKTYPNNM